MPRIEEVSEEERALVLASGYFDGEWYLSHNADVAAAGVDPLEHFLHYGCVELRDPGPKFSTSWYVEAVPELRGEPVNPLVHFLTEGRAMGIPACPSEHALDASESDLEGGGGVAESPGLELEPAAGPRGTNLGPRLLGAEPPLVVVYQMGRVASKSVWLSLTYWFRTHGYRTKVYHVHRLTKFEEARRLAYLTLADPEPALKDIAASMRVEGELESYRDVVWPVISLVRDPFARALSEFVFNLETRIPGYEGKLRSGVLSVEDVKQTFVEAYSKPLPDWFAEELQPALGIAVYDGEATNHPGAVEYPPSERARLLVARVEDLDRGATDAIARFLDIHDFRMFNFNTSASAPHGWLYSALKGLAYPADFVDHIYDVRWVRHFYSPEEIENFKAKWTSGQG